MRRAVTLFRLAIAAPLLCALLCAVVPLSAATARTDPEELIASARRALAEERPAQAVELLGRALDTAGEEGETGGALALGELHALLGRALVRIDDYAEAADHLARAVELGRDDLGTLLFLGSARWEAQRFESAAETLERAVERSGGTSAEFLAHHQLGRLLLWLGRPSEALGPLERAVEIRPDAFDARLDLARALDRSGASERAVAAYRRALDIVPQSPHAHYGLAQALLRVGERDEAAEALAVYRELYAADQDRTREEFLAEARLARARELFEAGELASAEEIVEGLPEAPLTLEALGRIRAGRGDYAGAVAALERAVALAPDRDDLRQLLAEARLLLQQEEGEGSGGAGSEDPLGP